MSSCLVFFTVTRMASSPLHVSPNPTSRHTLCELKRHKRLPPTLRNNCYDDFSSPSCPHYESLENKPRKLVGVVYIQTDTSDISSFTTYIWQLLIFISLFMEDLAIYFCHFNHHHYHHHRHHRHYHHHIIIIVIVIITTTIIIIIIIIIIITTTIIIIIIITIIIIIIIIIIIDVLRWKDPIRSLK